MDIEFNWRGAFESAEVETLHAEAFEHNLVVGYDWETQLRDHSLGWVCARAAGDLVGFVNVAWDGAAHAFILDTMVSGKIGRRGIGTELVSTSGWHALLSTR